jgi:hypothetical protein
MEQATLRAVQSMDHDGASPDQEPQEAAIVRLATARNATAYPHGPIGQIIIPQRHLNSNQPVRFRFRGREIAVK